MDLMFLQVLVGWVVHFGREIRIFCYAVIRVILGKSRKQISGVNFRSLSKTKKHNYTFRDFILFVRHEHKLGYFFNKKTLDIEVGQLHFFVFVFIFSCFLTILVTILMTRETLEFDRNPTICPEFIELIVMLMKIFSINIFKVMGQHVNFL